MASYALFARSLRPHALAVIITTVAAMLNIPVMTADSIDSFPDPACRWTSSCPMTDWAAEADSEQIEGGLAKYAVDGNPATVWHTQYSPTVAPLSHTFTINWYRTSIVTGLRYLPRGDGNRNGNIGQYQIHVRDGGDGWNLIAAGTFADDATAKVVRFRPTQANAIRLTALTEAGNRGPWSSAAEINPIGSPDVEYPSSGWTVTTDSQEDVGVSGTNAIDGNPATMWHTQSTPVSPALPHALIIDMHATNTISGLRYLPRTDGSPNGNIGQYQIHLSTDGVSWGSSVATGTFADNASEKNVSFASSTARYVRLTALTEAGNRGPWSSAAEINLTNNPLSTVQCAPSAPMYVTRTDGAFIQYQHLRPENGISSWGTQRQISTGFGADARRVAGPDGVIYSAVNNGELRRRRWNGIAWDTFGGGAQYEVVDTNSLWSRYSTPEYFNRITVDARGDIYTVEPDGWLHWRRFDSAARTWTHQLVASGWGDYDLISASGPGVIYARTAVFQSLSRFEYHPESQRSRRWIVGDGWGVFSRLFSPGGDLLYAVRADTGDLMWYRFDPNAETWANGDASEVPAGMRIGAGWQSNYEALAAPDSCQLTATGWIPPTRPQVGSRPNAPVTMMLSKDGHLHYSYVDAEGRAVYAEAADLTGGTPVRLAAVPGMINLTGPTAAAENGLGLIHIAANGLDAEAHINAHEGNGGQWGQADTLGGFFETPPTLFPAKWKNESFVVATSVAQDGARWIRHPVCTDSNRGPREPWNINGADRPDSPHFSTRHPLIVIPRYNGNSWQFIGQDDNGTIFAKADRTIGPHCLGGKQLKFPSTACGGCTTENWQSLGGTGFAGPVSVAPSANDRLQIFATRPDGVVYTQYTTSVWFPGTWTAVGAGFTAGGPPSSTLAPDGKIKVVVRGTDGLIYYTSQTAPDSTSFDPWQAIANTDESATDPTALAVPGSNTWVVAYRTDLDVPRLRRYVPPPGAVAASGQSNEFVDIPLTPPDA